MVKSQIKSQTSHDLDEVRCGNRRYQNPHRRPGITSINSRDIHSHFRAQIQARTLNPSVLGVIEGMSQLDIQPLVKDAGSAIALIISKCVVEQNLQNLKLCIKSNFQIIKVMKTQTAVHAIMNL